MESLTLLLQTLIAVALFLGAAIGLNFASVEGIKRLMRMLEASFAKVSWLKRPIEWLTPRGDKTFFLSLVMAFLFVVGYDISIFGDFSEFADVNPTYAQLAQAAIVSLFSNYIADKQ